jgi:hypothetical protein
MMMPIPRAFRKVSELWRVPGSREIHALELPACTIGEVEVQRIEHEPGSTPQEYLASALRHRLPGPDVGRVSHAGEPEWRTRYLTEAADVLELPAIGCRISLERIYSRVNFAQSETTRDLTVFPKDEGDRE